ncbi:acetyltransferase [Paraglaciecola sp.]|uniref:acetyltransferase n=1 Tax=Paraglaciecola sp. TaxID=1920173 RepID=UPI003EF49ED0
MNIDVPCKQDYLSLIEIWEESVRATHEFLPEENIKSLKSQILMFYFDAVELRGAKNENNEYVGFIGVADGNIEMLFVSPKYIGCGIGALLTNHAIKHQSAIKVDVNEQNPAAVGFYQHIGFKVVGRSELDGQGNPFPLLHMGLET